ncbi:response regulator [Chitinophaga sp. MM2321]|uniref:response regulator transcription factor n=1 Tax=Chitinophaga sp. MM2321 TaxID=3137178 RepID=UPI0032D592C5
MGRKILFVEKEPEQATQTKLKLEASGYEVTHLDNGSLAWGQYLGAEYDLCLIDANIRKMNGYQLIAAIRKVNNNIPILFTSSSTSENDALKALGLGADDFLPKPYDQMKLQQRLHCWTSKFPTKEERGIKKEKPTSAAGANEQELKKKNITDPQKGAPSKASKKNDKGKQKKNKP